ncbi:MAG TPA: response regulator [Candidatus Bathyarchaeota archaeon]|nr:response regulator [Candidatus Bathyarchaeota archaeon]
MALKYEVTERPILLVDDNADDIMIAKRAFKECDIRNKVYVTYDGDEAIQFLRKEGKFKDVPTSGLVILDLNMPKVDGFEVLKTIKGDDKLKSIPIIVLTSSSRPEDIERAYKLGCNSFIVKPVSFEDFVEAVMEIKRYWLSLAKLPYNHEKKNGDD